MGRRSDIRVLVSYPGGHVALSQAHVAAVPDLPAFVRWAVTDGRLRPATITIYAQRVAAHARGGSESNGQTGRVLHRRGVALSSVDTSALRLYWRWENDRRAARIRPLVELGYGIGLLRSARVRDLIPPDDAHLLWRLSVVDGETLRVAHEREREDCVSPVVVDVAIPVDHFDVVCAAIRDAWPGAEPPPEARLFGEGSCDDCDLPLAWPLATGRMLCGCAPLPWSTATTT